MHKIDCEERKSFSSLMLNWLFTGERGLPGLPGAPGQPGMRGIRGLRGEVGQIGRQGKIFIGTSINKYKQISSSRNHNSTYHWIHS